MKRVLTDKLKKWKSSRNRKPLLLRGARQVGKTWLMFRFGEREYVNLAYINFEGNHRMRELFSYDYDIIRIIRGLEIESGEKILAKDTLIILDEIQEAPAALTALKYFCEKAPEYHVIAAGSLLGVALHQNCAFPVGKVSFLDLYPLSFREFIHAVAEDDLIKLHESRDWIMINTFRQKFIELLKQYYYVGGMPEVVKRFRDNRDLREVRELQKQILAAYEQDFSKYAPNEIVPRIRMLWNSLPAQLCRENKKFVYGKIRSGARARDYELAMTWLIDCGLIHKVTRINKPELPLKAFEDIRNFKLFVSDVGLLGAMTALDAKSLLEGNRLFAVFKGAMTEQYFFQQLVPQKELAIYYWSHDRGMAEVDFVLQCNSRIIPVEVKAELNLQSKSLRSYQERFNPEISIKSSMADFNQSEKIINLPLYNIHDIKSVVETTVAAFGEKDKN